MSSSPIGYSNPPLTGSRAVSYTHLDVYKRQALEKMMIYSLVIYIKVLLIYFL